MSDLLPTNSTPFERALSESTGRAFELEAGSLRTLWNPDTCPEALLNQLAWALAVDEWDDSWPEAVKRDVIRTVMEVHRHRGTVHAVRQALASLGAEIELEEWPQTGGAPHTFRLTAWVNENMGGDVVLSDAFYRQLRRRVDAAKPVRSHYDMRVGTAMNHTIAATAISGSLQMSRQAAEAVAPPLTGTGGFVSAAVFDGFTIARMEVSM